MSVWSSVFASPLAAFTLSFLSDSSHDIGIGTSRVREAAEPQETHPELKQHPKDNKYEKAENSSRYFN